MTPNPATLARIAPLLFVFLWSTGFIGAKFGLPHAEPLSFLFVRYLLVLGLMTPLALATRAPWPRDPQQWLHIGVSGLLVHATYLGGVFVAISHGLPAGITSLLVGLQPILTAVGAGWLLAEGVSRRQWLGLWLGLAGTTLVVGADLALDRPAAELLPMLAPAVAALAGITAGTLYQKRFCPHFDLRSGAVIQFLPTAIVTGIAVAAFESMAIDWTGEFIFALAWLVGVLSLGAISLLNLMIRQGSAVRVASLFFLTPPTTAVIAFLLFDERLSTAAVAGLIVAVIGVRMARKAA